MRLAELSYLEAEEKVSSDLCGDHGALEEYRPRTIQCLVTADYTNPVAYIVEILLLYIGAEWLSSQGAGIEISLVLGMAIRPTMRMGIHRDSSNHSDISPFQGEMRRRIWATLHEMDILYSFQLSFPTTIRRSSCDCGFPQNLSNDDFGKDTRGLPPPGSLAEATAVSYTITKYRFTLLLGEIITLCESRNNTSPNDILRQRPQWTCSSPSNALASIEYASWHSAFCTVNFCRTPAAIPQSLYSIIGPLYIWTSIQLTLKMSRKGICPLFLRATSSLLAWLLL